MHNISQVWFSYARFRIPATLPCWSGAGWIHNPWAAASISLEVIPGTEGATQPPSSPPTGPRLGVVAEARQGRGGGGWKEAAFALLCERRKRQSQRSCAEGMRGGGQGELVKLLPVLSVLITAPQSPRDIWQPVSDRRFFPYIICCKNSWGTGTLIIWHTIHFCPLNKTEPSCEDLKNMSSNQPSPSKIKKNPNEREPSTFLSLIHAPCFCFAVPRNSCKCLCKLAN